MKNAEVTQGEASSGVEDFIVVMTSCLGERTFIVDYENYFPFEDDLSLLQQASIYMSVLCCIYCHSCIYDKYNFLFS